MNSQNVCLKCGSEKMMNQVRILDNLDSALQVIVDKRPDAKVFKKSVKTTLSAKICGDCGYVAFYATEPDKLWAAHEEGVVRGGLSLSEDHNGLSLSE